MTTTQHAPASLQSRAMLATLTVSQWGGQRQDKAISREVAFSHGADENVGRYTKSLVAKNALSKITNIVSGARAQHKALTMPWGDDGYRILPSALYFKHVKAMNEYRGMFDAAVNEFIANYSEHIEQAKRMLKYVDAANPGMFNASDYPTPEELRSLFRFSVNIMPVPDAPDFRMDIPEEELQQIQENNMLAVRASLLESTVEGYRRMYKSVKNLMDRLNREEKEGERFHKSFIDNVREIADAMPHLNIARDPELDEMAGEIRASLCHYDPSDFKESPELRSETAKAAEEILSKMQDYLG